MQKSPTQILFERLVRSWIIPAAHRVAQEKALPGPVPLRSALIIWEASARPSVYLNAETYGKVRKASVKATRAIRAGEAIVANDIGGITDVVLDGRYKGKPFVFVLGGHADRYYVHSWGTDRVLRTAEFELLHERLGTEGLELTAGSSLMPLYVDLWRNRSRGAPEEKAKVTVELKAHLIATVKQDATERARRHLKLPTLLVRQDDPSLHLLLEARGTYVDGHYISAIATSATAADRICLQLADRYGLDRGTRSWLREQTRGQKIEKLVAQRVLPSELRRVLFVLNNLRKRHIHPRKRPSRRTEKRDALIAVRLLHRVLEDTGSVLRDYRIEEGILMPRPIE